MESFFLWSAVIFMCVASIFTVSMFNRLFPKKVQYSSDKYLSTIKYGPYISDIFRSTIFTIMTDESSPKTFVFTGSDKIATSCFIYKTKQGRFKHVWKVYSSDKHSSSELYEMVRKIKHELY